VKIFSLFITKVNYYIELYICSIVPGTILFYIPSLHKSDYVSKYYMMYTLSKLSTVITK